MIDYVIFLKDIKEFENVIFKKGNKYEILDENKQSYFIQMTPKTNQVCEYPKIFEGNHYKLIK